MNCNFCGSEISATEMKVDVGYGYEHEYCFNKDTTQPTEQGRVQGETAKAGQPAGTEREIPGSARHGSVDLDYLERLEKEARAQLGTSKRDKWLLWTVEIQKAAPALIARIRELEAEASRVAAAIERAEVGIERKGRDLDDWLAQVLQALVATADCVPLLEEKLAAKDKLLHEWNREASKHFAGSEYHDDPKNVFARVTQTKDSLMDSIRDRARLRADNAAKDAALKKIREILPAPSASNWTFVDYYYAVLKVHGHVDAALAPRAGEGLRREHPDTAILDKLDALLKDGGWPRIEIDGDAGAMCVCGTCKASGHPDIRSAVDGFDAARRPDAGEPTA